MAVASEYADPRALLALLPFVRELGISIVSAEPGAVVVEMPFAERFSTPPNHFPASIVGTLGDVAAVSSCTSRLPRGWAGATLDYTVKMTAPAQGERLLARGRVLQAGQTISVGRRRHLRGLGRQRGALRHGARDRPQLPAEELE